MLAPRNVSAPVDLFTWSHFTLHARFEVLRNFFSKVVEALISRQAGLILQFSQWNQEQLLNDIQFFVKSGEDPGFFLGIMHL